MFNKLLFPNYCVNCGSLGSYICRNCEKKLEVLDFPLCMICENLSINGKTHKVCKTKYTIENFYSPYIYSKVVKNIIIKSKEGQNSFKLLDVLLNHDSNQKILKEINKPDIIVPIPTKNHITSKRIINHASYISDYIGSYFKVPKVLCLYKISAKKQKSFNRQERFMFNNNIKLVSEEKENILCKNILLVDDVSTTGTTLSSVSKLLIMNGANKIQCYSLCKDLRYNTKSNV